MSDYIDGKVDITPFTLAVLSQKTESGELITCILDERLEYVLSIPPTKVMEKACEYYGSSLEGRLAGARSVSGFMYKSPIAVDPSLDMYFFPTSSPRNKTCSWLAHTHIDNVHPTNNKKSSQIIFKNGRDIILPVSYVSMEKQLARAAQYRFALESRQSIQNGHFNF